MFKQKLESIQSDLLGHKNSSDEVMYKLINDRLNKSLDAYIKSLSISFEYVSNKNSLNVMNKLVRKS